MDPPTQSIIYKNVVALLLLPQCPDRNIPEEIDRLVVIFDELYQYHWRLEMVQMGGYRSRRDAPNLPYCSRIDQRDDALWILYYSGSNDAEALMETLKYMSRSDERSRGPQSLNGEALRQYADVLCILDCPLPAEWEDIANQIIAQRPAAQHTRTSLFEILAANPPDWTPQSRSSTSTSTSTESDPAFVHALCWALETFSDSRENCSVAELAAKIRDAPDFPRDQMPVHKICNRPCPERIILCPSASPGVPMLPYDPASDDEPAKKTVRKDVLGLGKVLKRKQRRRGSVDE